MFKKIFDLNPKEVENFIKALVLDYYKRNLGDDFAYDEKDKTIKVEWYPADDEFYVHLQMTLEWNNDLREYVDKDGNIPTLKRYLGVESNHWHFTFQEIYGLMTGETTYIYGFNNPEDGSKMLFVYKKEYTQVVLKDNKWFVYDYEDESEKEIFSDVPEDLLKEIEKYI